MQAIWWPTLTATELLLPITTKIKLQWIPGNKVLWCPKGLRYRYLAEWFSAAHRWQRKALFLAIQITWESHENWVTHTHEQSFCARY